MIYHIFADRSKTDRKRELDTVTVTSEKHLKILQKRTTIQVGKNIQKDKIVTTDYRDPKCKQMGQQERLHKDVPCVQH